MSPVDSVSQGCFQIFSQSNSSTKPKQTNKQNAKKKLPNKKTNHAIRSMSRYWQKVSINRIGSWLVAGWKCFGVSSLSPLISKGSPRLLFETTHHLKWRTHISKDIRKKCRFQRLLLGCLNLLIDPFNRPILDPFWRNLTVKRERGRVNIYVFDDFFERPLNNTSHNLEILIDCQTYIASELLASIDHENIMLLGYLNFRCKF